MQVGKRVREARERRGWTQEQLAHRIDIAAATLSRYELGRKNVNLETLRRAAIALDVPIARFFDEVSLGSLPPMKASIPRGRLPGQRQEAELLSLFRRLKPKERGRFLEVGELLAASRRKPPKK